MTKITKDEHDRFKERVGLARRLGRAWADLEPAHQLFILSTYIDIDELRVIVAREEAARK